MQTQEIVDLTRQNIVELVKLRQQAHKAAVYEGGDRRGATQSKSPDFKAGDRRGSKVRDRRRHPFRWSSSGMVELSSPGGEGRAPCIGTCTDLTIAGLGLMADRSFPIGTVVDFSCHLPELTICGRATVMHCTEVKRGFKLGVEFLFDA